MKSLEQITIDLLRDPRSWVLGTHLCMKKPRDRPDGVFPRCGIIRAHDYGVGPIRIENHPVALHGEFVETFDSADEVVAGGWVVD